MISASIFATVRGAGPVGPPPKNDIFFCNSCHYRSANLFRLMISCRCKKCPAFYQHWRHRKWSRSALKASQPLVEWRILTGLPWPVNIVFTFHFNSRYYDRWQLIAFHDHRFLEEGSCLCFFSEKFDTANGKLPHAHLPQIHKEKS